MIRKIAAVAFGSFAMTTQIKNRPEDEVLAEATIRNIQYFAGAQQRRK